MKTLKPICFLFSMLLLHMANAQETSPTLKGNVNISIKKGTIECEFTLSDLPDIDVKDYVIRINSGMNIRFFRDSVQKGPLDYDMDKRDSTSSGETHAYYLHEKLYGHDRYLPKQIRFRYGGMYPVVPDSASGYMVGDWRGNVAFNGHSLRADGLQSGWYPVLFDLKKQIRYEKVRYDVHINCEDCTVLFANGSAPVKASSATFKSDVPHELAIYCGNFETAEINNTWLLNPDMSKEQQKIFLDMIGDYKAYYSKNMGIPYKGNMTFIQTSPTATPSMWAFSFVASPTIINVGTGKYGMKAIFDKGGESNKESMAHELGHYYFGTLLRTNTVFGHVIEEGCTEYLAFKVTKNLIGEEAYQALFNRKLKAMKYLKISAWSQVRTEDDYHNRELYLYYYTPVLLSAIEKEVGEKAMWKWMKIMVETKAPLTDYSFFEKAFDAAMTDKALAQQIKDKYFTTNKSLDYAAAELGKSDLIRR